MHGLDPTHKAARLANYVVTLRKELTRLCGAAGVEHPGLLQADHLEILDDRYWRVEETPTTTLRIPAGAAGPTAAALERDDFVQVRVIGQDIHQPAMHDPGDVR